MNPVNRISIAPSTLQVTTAAATTLSKLQPQSGLKASPLVNAATRSMIASAVTDLDPQTQLESLLAELAKVKEAISSKLLQLERRRLAAESTQTISGSDGSLEGINRQIDSLKSELAKVESEIKELMMRLEKLRSASDSSQQQTGELQQRILQNLNKAAESYQQIWDAVSLPN